MTKGKPSSDDLLPLTPAVFHILLALADGEKHGYAIMQIVDELSNGKVKMGPGTLYGSIKRMQKNRLIIEIDEPANADNSDERRRYYKLTNFGQQVATLEARRLQHLMNSAQTQRLLGET